LKEDAILVIRPSSLGDIVHALALVADVRTHRPELAIDWVAEERFVPLLALDPDVRRVIPVALRRWRHRLFDANTWREMTLFRHDLRRESYLAILDLQEQVKSALIARMARGRRHGPDRRSIREPLATLAHNAHHAINPAQHLIDRCRQLAAAALDYRVEGRPRFRLQPPPPSVDVPAPDRPYLVFVHATSRADKLWSDAHWRTLIAMFARAGFSIMLPWGSAAERERSERLAKHETGRLRSGTAIAAIGRRPPCSRELVVGVDTGLVHLAAALGTPTISLFVATDPALAGVARASPLAVDLGGVGHAPTPHEVRDAATILMQARTEFLTPSVLRKLYTLLWFAVLPLLPLRLWWRSRREPGYASMSASASDEACRRFAHRYCGCTRCRWAKREPQRPLIDRLTRNFPTLRCC
jgi:heptosyltransferase-1